MHGLLSRELLPPPDSLIAIEGGQLDKARLTLGSLAGDKGRAAAPKTIKHEIAAAGAVADSVSYERDRLDCGMHG